MRRSGGTPRVALDHAVLHLDRAADGVDDATELDDRAVAGALDDAAVVDRDRRVDEVAAERSKPRQDAVLVRSGEPTVAGDIRHQNCCEFPGLGHGAPSRSCRIAQGGLEPSVDYLSKAIRRGSQPKPKGENGG